MFGWKDSGKEQDGRKGKKEMYGRGEGRVGRSTVRETRREERRDE